jgi:hypothetical protein
LRGSSVVFAIIMPWHLSVAIFAYSFLICI